MGQISVKIHAPPGSTLSDNQQSEPRKKITNLSDIQKRALMRAAESDQDPLTALFVMIAAGTGMRHSEILRMAWQDLNFDQARVHIAQAKAGAREQPMPRWRAEALREEWKQLGRPEGCLFPSRSGARHPHRTTMATQFRRSVERAKLDPAKITPHILGHTAMIKLVQARVDLPSIQRISGDKTLTMVLRYTQLSDAHVDESISVLESVTDRQITPKLHKGPRSQAPTLAQLK